MSFRLPVGFWKNFAEEIWEKKPTVFKKLFDGQHLAPPEELFRIIADEQVRYGQISGDWMKRRQHRFIIDKGQVTHHLPYMPCPEDGSFEGWARRMYQELPGRGFMFHMQSLQSKSTLLFDRYRQFTDGMFEHIGLPSMRVDADIFAGDYSETFFGVHKDLTGNFAFITTGRKRMLLWPYEMLVPYAKGKLDPIGYDYALQLRSMKEIREPAPIVLEGEPGDVFYWPGRFWHCAQGNGALSITNNLAVYTTYSPLTDSFPDKVFEVLQPNIDQNMPFMPFDRARRQQWAATPPAELRDASARVVEGFKKLVEGGLELEMELTWLRYLSGGGFTVVPQPDPDVKLDEAQAMKLDPDAGLVWRKLCSGEIGVSTNGLSACFPPSKGLEETLQRLSGGGSHRVGALLDEATEERQGDKVVWSREHMRELLTTLAAQRSLVRA